MKLPSHLPGRLLIGIFVGLAAGCAPKPPAPIGPTARETELLKTVEELRGKLAAAEQATEQAKAETARALTLVKSEPTTSVSTANTSSSPSTEIKTPDTSYIVVKKTLTVGQLISKATSANPGLTERRPAEYRITFKGVQSGKEYPPLEVQEVAYGRFREGVVYLPQDINAAKKPAFAATDAAKTGATSTGGAAPMPSEAELRALFGN